jgi:UDP-glucose 4-epimerase
MERIEGARVVVTGGAGFIGSHLVRQLVERRAAQVVVIDSLRYGDPANLGELPGVALVRHELGRDPDAALEPALDGCELVFHLAAEKHNQSKDEPSRVIAANVTGSLALYEKACAAGARRIVFTSSLYAYGRMAGGPFVESERCEPRTVYGVTKLAGEHLLGHVSRERGVPYAVLRYLFIYGPKQFAGMGYKSVIVKSFEHLLAGNPPVVYGDGTQALDYVYVDDCVEATIRAMEHESSGEVFNIASGVATPVKTLIDTIVAVSGSKLEPEHGPADWTAGSERFGDPSKAARVLGWHATTPLEEGLRATLAWVKAGV